MAVTQTSDILVPQILTDAVRPALRGKNALMGSILVTSGAVTVAGTMPMSGPKTIGTTVRIPYWGRLGAFASNAEGSSVTPSKISQTYEDATVARSSLAFEVSAWARGAGMVAPAEDPYDVCAEQIATEARREMDRQMVAAGTSAGMLYALYSATVPHYLTFQDVVNAKAIRMGDDQDGIVAMVVHSLVAADLANQLDSTGRPVLTQPVDGSVMRVAGVPVLISDRVTLTGSSMGTVTSSGTTPPGITLTGTPTGPWQLHIDIVGAGTVGTATFRFSTDGGTTWSATIATAASVALTDTAVDSLVGNNGATGITCAFTAGTHAADNLYVSTANISAESQIWTQGAGAFWYNEQALALKTDSDILEDTDIAAMHLYAAPHVYRRRNGGTRPGVLRITSNVRGFVG